MIYQYVLNQTHKRLTKGDCQPCNISLAKILVELMYYQMKRRKKEKYLKLEDHRSQCRQGEGMLSLWEGCAPLRKNKIIK